MQNEPILRDYLFILTELSTFNNLHHFILSFQTTEISIN